MQTFVKSRLLKGLLFVWLAAAATAGHAQDTISLKVYFKQSEYVINRDYRDNGRKLDRFIREINDSQRDSATFINYISIMTGCSPEGDFEFNENLALKRARAIRAYLVNRVAVNASQIRTFSTGINWEEFYNTIYADINFREENFPWRTETLNILTKYCLKTTISKEDSDNCLRDLRRLDNGQAWAWISDSGLLEELRQASGTITCVLGSQNTSQKDTIVIIHEYQNTSSSETALDKNTIALLVDSLKNNDHNKTKSFKKDSLFRQPVFAFRTNLLVPLTNIGIEIPLGNRWSIEADWYSPWVYRNWMNQICNYYENCFQVQLAYLEARIWLGRKHSNRYGNPLYRLRGHSIGFGAGAFHYDLGYEREGEQGDGAAFGLDYQYAQPLGKGGAHLEFTIGVCGYWRTYRKYKVEDDRWDGDVRIQSNRLLADGKRQEEYFVAPFRACISLVVPIFKKQNKEVTK